MINSNYFSSQTKQIFKPDNWHSLWNTRKIIYLWNTRKIIYLWILSNL